MLLKFVMGKELKINVIGIGDNVCDIYVDSRRMYPGGQALNFAVYSKLMGANASYIGVFGNDAIAEHIVNTLDQLGVEYKYSRHTKGESGYARVRHVDGDRIFVDSNKGGVSGEQPIVLDSNDIKYIEQFDLVHTSNNSYINSELVKISQTTVPVSYDFSKKWTEKQLIDSVCKYIDFGFLSCNGESEKDIDKICIKMHDKGCKIVVATMGSEGAILSDNGFKIRQEPKLVDAVDTLGAGDSFAAGFLLHVITMFKQEPERMEADDFRRSVLKSGLENAAEFAAGNCMVKGAFGFGVDVPPELKSKLIFESGL